MKTPGPSIVDPGVIGILSCAKSSLTAAIFLAMAEREGIYIYMDAIDKRSLTTKPVPKLEKLRTVAANNKEGRRR